jgi:DNA-binding response OmpR family regulator
MSQPKVLIVDDDTDSRAVLRDVLGREPYNLLEASDGQQALEIAASELPDLILLDVMMPGMDGALVLRNLMEHEKTRSIPVILVTALDLLDAQACACLGNGAMDHICKPFSSAVVRSRVRALLHSRVLSAGNNSPTAK